jgi:hypothetical protein
MLPEEPLRTLRYWFDVEALAAPDAERHDGSCDKFTVRYVRDGSYPWQTRQPLPRRHFVRFGVIPRKSFDSELLAMLKTEPRPDDDSGRRIVHKDFTFLGVFQTDDAGAPQPDTLEMAAFASAFVSLSGSKVIAFGKYQKTMQEAFQWACEDAARIECQVDDDFVSALTSRALEELGWTPAGIDCALVIVRSAPVKDERGRTLDPKIDPVNGFFLDDLAMVLEKVSTQKGQTGLVLPYLTEADEGFRCDCTTLEALKRTLTVDRTPDGRWPAEHTLTPMQQVAVNQAVGSLTSGGIFSINGPPGTGKRPC